MSTVPDCILCDLPVHPHMLPDGSPYWLRGHNAQPVADGRCCDACHPLIISARLGVVRHIHAWRTSAKVRRAQYDSEIEEMV